MAPSDMACVVLTYTSPWPANHPKSNEYFSDPRLSAYEVLYRQVMAVDDSRKSYTRKEVAILRSKPHCD
ncbi:hypothetical protein ISN44_As13g009410 [Arabidopsis suecica]|uniref:Uncharacterized protein n=1 Tax=Arabidopsis suecica TaxID=45249 RepID=A0A8T1Y123_ARASU|nr:hypothetical protein ISN44_As13g009410 [Arabidopsis suecica]